MRRPLATQAFAITLVFGAALTAAASAAAPPGGHWRDRAPMAARSPGSAGSATTVFAGNTAPEFSPMVLELGKARVARLSVHYSTQCFSYTSRLGAFALRKAAVDAKGRFSATVVTSLVDSPRIWTDGQRYPDRVVETIAGTVGPAVARGTLRATVTFLDGSSCTTGEQRWLVTHKPGRIFGGVTSEGMPVSEELSASGARIKHLHIGWTAACPDGSAWVVPDFLTNFTLSGGVARAAFTLDYPDGQGGKVTYGYELSSRVGSSKASGNLRVTVMSADAAGAVTSTCSSKAITWTARS